MLREWVWEPAGGGVLLKPSIVSAAAKKGICQFHFLLPSRRTSVRRAKAVRRCCFWLNPFPLPISDKWKLMGYRFIHSFRGGENLTANAE